MELLTDRDENLMSMTKIESVDDKIVVSVVKFKNNLNVSSDRGVFNKHDTLNKNQFIINSMLKN